MTSQPRKKNDRKLERRELFQDPVLTLKVVLLHPCAGVGVAREEGTTTRQNPRGVLGDPGGRVTPPVPLRGRYVYGTDTVHWVVDPSSHDRGRDTGTGGTRVGLDPEGRKMDRVGWVGVLPRVSYVQGLSTGATRKQGGLT